MAFETNTYACGGTALAAFQMITFPCGGTALAAFEVNPLPFEAGRHLKLTPTLVAGRCLWYSILTPTHLFQWNRGTKANF